MLFTKLGSTLRINSNRISHSCLLTSTPCRGLKAAVFPPARLLLEQHPRPAVPNSLTSSWQIRYFFSRGKGRPKRPRTTAEKNKTTVMYLTSAVMATVGASYAAVPLYKAFCQATSYGGTISQGHDTSKVEDMEKKTERLIQVRFNADTAATMRWNFRPQQPVVYVHPGETALAFYTARNPTDKPIDGISTYNVVPFEAGQYFNKIQCFCFEEQRLNPGEEVDMPVFFYIDPDFTDDPFLQDCNEITLSYTFFESRPGLVLPTYNSSGYKS